MAYKLLWSINYHVILRYKYTGNMRHLHVHGEIAITTCMLYGNLILLLLRSCMRLEQFPHLTKSTGIISVQFPFSQNQWFCRRVWMSASQIANRIVGRSSPLTLLGPIGSLTRFVKICYLPASRSWTSMCQQEYQTCTCNAIATYWRKFPLLTVHTFALPRFVQLVRCRATPTNGKIENRNV